MKLFVLNGPNLNMLGQRDAEQYGSETLDDIQALVEKSFPDYQFTFYQSNSEGELVSAIHKLVNGPYDGLVANFGAYTHTSVAIRDALEMVTVPKVEVHLSNIHAREKFRHRTLSGSVSTGIIAGFGKYSYLLGVEAIEKLGED